MFAINHAATALIIKKIYPGVPIIFILLSSQVMEILWVLLNFLGLERTTTNAEVRYVGDVHLSHMPFSHSVVTMSGVAVMSWLVLSQGFGLTAIGAAVGLAIASHLVLDLITHDRDISLAPFRPTPKLGLGLYARHPGAAFLLELAYGISCWALYGGGPALLIVIVLFNAANVSLFFKAVPGFERKLAGRPRLIAAVILGQIVITMALVWLLS